MFNRFLFLLNYKRKVEKQRINNKEQDLMLRYPTNGLYFVTYKYFDANYEATKILLKEISTVNWYQQYR